MAISEILTALMKIFIIIIPGYILSKKKILNDDQAKGISSIVLNVTWPCLVVASLQMPFSEELLVNSGYIIVAITIIFFAAYLISTLTCKAIKMNKQKAYLFTFMLLFSNTGFMGIPVAGALYGSEGIFYAALRDSLGDIFVFTIGMMLIRKSTAAEKAHMNPKELLTPGFFSIVIGIALFLLNIELPNFIGDSLDIIGSATTPLAMLIIGLQLGKVNFKELLGDGKLYLLSALKLIAMPTLILLALHFIIGDLSLFLKLIILEEAMPVATCTVIFTEQYNGDANFAAKGVLLSTVLSIITIPIFAILIEML
ncbi:MAG TPA: AEC family transporter [Anaerovoracaceae bacterium]|nr:AEC family transporter [Anaerovoracaceae bacterium]